MSRTNQSLSYGGRVGVIGTSGKSKTQNLLAQQAAPPPMSRLSPVEYLIAVFLFLVSMSVFSALLFSGVPLFGMLLAAVAAGFILLRSQLNSVKKDLWHESLQKWRATWMCLRCCFTWSM